MKEIIVDINALVYEGYGIGRLPDGKAVFVPFVLPEEQVRINIKEEKKQFAYGELIEVVKSSDQRIPPTCMHYGMCGGCQYQHIPYDLQLKNKIDIFHEQLKRIGNITDPFIEKIIPSSQEWNYRNTLQFHLTQDGSMAFMDASQAHAFKVEECHLPMDEISKVWPLLAFDNENQIDRIEIRQNEHGEVLVKLDGRQSAIPDIEITSSISVVHSNLNEQIVIAGDDHLMVSLGGKDFRISAGSFFQTNFSGAQILVKEVQEMAAGLHGTLLDLYCGVGLFSLNLADSFDHIIGIESSSSACGDFAENLDSYNHISLYEGTVEEILPELDGMPDCILVDPPRKGLHRFALDALVNKKPPVIIYVSCNPATLARDVKRLMRSGYALDRSVLVDLFPQTYHVETVVLMSRKDK